MAAVQRDWSSIVPSREDTRGCTRYTRRTRVTLRDRAQSDSLQALTFTLPAVESVFIVIAVAWKRGCMHMHTYVSTRLNTKFAGFKVELVVQGFLEIKRYQEEMILDLDRINLFNGIQIFRRGI